LVTNDGRKLAVIAIGGNSLIKDKEHQTVQDQYMAVAETCGHIADLIEGGYRVVITHGNGPQVGFILLRSEMCRDKLHTVPLDSCGADTQGAIGYQIQRALVNEWHRRGQDDKQVATVVTQVLVDASDPSFNNPSKPIGPFYSREEASARRDSEGGHIVEDAGRGWRRVVPSPYPRQILEIDAIAALVESGVTVVAAGGGGIPVKRDSRGQLEGVAAVIDKDLAGSLLARKLGADVFIISTAVDKVYLNFGTPEQHPVDRMTVEQARQYMSEGHFKPGSMLPKIKAAIEFLEAGGQLAVITDPQNIGRAAAGRSGTLIVP